MDDLIDSRAHLAERWGKSFRFVPPQKLHLTWMFLGDCDDKTQELVLEILDAKVKKANESYELDYDKFAIWPKECSPRVGVLIASKPPESFVQLVQNIQAEISPLLKSPGVQHEKYKPHITLIRFKAKCFSIADFQDHLSFKQSISEVSLIRSDLQSYETIASFKLK